ncbi:telomere-associated protein RIF1-like [Argonauta hians]
MLVPKSEMKLKNLLSTLKSPDCNTKIKLDTYSTFCNQLKADNKDATFAQDVAKNIKQVFTLLLSDIEESSAKITENALQVLGHCLQNEAIVSSLSSKDCNEILQDVAECVLGTEDIAVCTQGLWCLANQIFPPAVVGNQMNPMLNALEHSFSKPLSQSVLVEHEAVNLVVKLLEQVPQKMTEKAVKWSHHVYFLLGHGAIRIREKALQALSIALPALIVNPNGLVTSMVTDVKTKMASELKRLFQKRNEVYVIRVWSLLVQLLGKELHCVFINQLLPIVELGFKSPDPNIKFEAFNAWKYLIENFASNPAIIGDQKRIKLLMQVFKINNAKTEAVALKKMEVWWYFVRKLDTKLLGNFDMVCTPLLRFVVGGKWTQGTRNTPTPNTSSSSLSLPSQGTSWPVFPSLQMKGLEAIGHLLQLPVGHLDHPYIKFELEPLNPNVIMGPALFLKQCTVIAYSLVELVCMVKAPDDLVVHLWSLLVEHLKLGLEAGFKADSKDALSSFLCDFSTLILSRPAPHSIKHKLFLIVTKLPRHILCSTAYNITSGEKIHGTPALFLTELLLTPSMLEEGISTEKYIKIYISLFVTMIDLGMANPSGVLEYCQSVIQILDRHATYVKQKEQLWRLWSCLVNPLLDFIIKNKEINQGDALEHNFDCHYIALFFPIKWLFGSQLFLSINKTLIKIWSSIYRTFASLAALVVNAAPNVTCEHLSHLIITELLTPTGQQKLKADPLFAEHLSLICETILSSVDFSPHNRNTSFAIGSPGKWGGKRKQNPLKNLSCFIDLVVLSIEAVCEQIENLGSDSKQNSNFVSLQSACKHFVAIMSTLYTEITSPNSVQLLLEKTSKAISLLFILAKPNCKIFPSSSLQKHDKLWQDIINCVQNTYKGMYDTDFLNILTPMLEVNFLHPRRFIKNQTALLWKATFSQAPSLIYPESLRGALAKVKEKLVIGLPGWISTEIHVIQETPPSQYSQGSSQVSDEVFPAPVSPNKIHGSLLKNVPSPKKPDVDAKPKPLPSVLKKLPIGEMKDQDFVVIEPPQNKKRILTQHQKEVLKERKYCLPAMYNSLDQSQDSMYSNSMVPSSLVSFSSDETSCSQYNLITANKSNQENYGKPNKKVTFSKDTKFQEAIPSVSMEKTTEFIENPQAACVKVESYTKIQPVANIPRIKTTRCKESANIKTGKIQKNISEEQPTPLQNWLCASQSSKVAANTHYLEPHVNSLVEDSLTNDSLPAVSKPVESCLIVEETQSPIRICPSSTGESVLETPVKTLTKEVNTSVNIRRLSFDLNDNSNSDAAIGNSGGFEIQEAKDLKCSTMKSLELIPSNVNPQNISSGKIPVYNVACPTILVPYRDDACKDFTQQNATAKPQKHKLAFEESVSDIKKPHLEGNNSVRIQNSSCVNKVKLIAQSSGNVSPSKPLARADALTVSNKRITGSRKRKPLKVTKIVQNIERRISPVRTRSHVKILQARRKMNQVFENNSNKSSYKKKMDRKTNKARKVLNVSEKEKNSSRHPNTGAKKVTSVKRNLEKAVEITKIPAKPICEDDSAVDNSDSIKSCALAETQGFSCDQELVAADTNVVEQKIEKNVSASTVLENENIELVKADTMQSEPNRKEPKSESKVEEIDSDATVCENESSGQEENPVEPDLVEMEKENKMNPGEEIQSGEIKAPVIEIRVIDEPTGLTRAEDQCTNEQQEKITCLTEKSVNKIQDVDPVACCEIESQVSTEANKNVDLNENEDSENKCDLEKVNTPKKSLRLRSGNRGFPLKFSDSLVYGIKVTSCSGSSNTRKNLNQKSVMKTSPSDRDGTGDGEDHTLFSPVANDIFSPEKQFLSSSLCDTPESCPSASCSPSAVYSPTTGILKKRLQCSGETPSPPNKQRRVSFADPIFEEKTLPSPVSQKRRLTPCNSRTSRRSLLPNYKKRDSIGNGMSCNSPGSSQSSYCSTQESQLSTNGPVFAELVSCQDPIGLILPQLTSSMWSRGLSQLLKARKIHTVGDLASLSEYSIHNLPVRSPKVIHVKKILANYKRQLDSKKDKSSGCLLNTSAGEIMAAAMAAAAATATVNAVSDMKKDCLKENTTSDSKNVSKPSVPENPDEQAPSSKTEENSKPTGHAEKESVEDKEKLMETDKKMDKQSSERDEKIPESSSEPDEKIPELSSERDEKIDESSSERDEKIDESPSEPDEKIDESSSERDEKIDESSSERDEKIDESSSERDEKINESSSERNDKINESISEKDEKMVIDHLHLPHVDVSFSVKPDKKDQQLYVPPSAVHETLHKSSHETDCRMPQKNPLCAEDIPHEVSNSPETKKKTTDSSLCTEQQQAQIAEEKESSLQEMPELDSSNSSVKLDIDEVVTTENTEEMVSDAASSVQPKVLSQESQLTQPPSCEIAPCVPQDIPPSSSVPTIMENPGASSTPVKTVKAKPEEKDGVRVSVHESSIPMAGLSCSPIKPVCTGSTPAAEDEHEDKDIFGGDEDDDEEEDEKDISTVEEDVNSILEHSSALLEEVHKLSLSVQELEKTSNTFKFLKSDYSRDEHCQGTEGFEVDHLLPSQSSKSLQQSKPARDTSVQKDLELLPTLENLLERFTSKELRRLNYSDILRVHSLLQNLLKSTMEAAIPETACPQKD